MAETERVIVTGATGSIGSSLCRELIKRGYAVVVFSRDPAAAQTVVPGAEAYSLCGMAGRRGWPLGGVY